MFPKIYSFFFPPGDPADFAGNFPKEEEALDILQFGRDFQSILCFSSSKNDWEIAFQTYNEVLNLKNFSPAGGILITLYNLTSRIGSGKKD